MYCGDVLDVPLEGVFDAVLCDPPYELKSGKNSKGGFMGQRWDATGVAFQPETWEKILAVCKPGAPIMAFGGTRTHHRLMAAIEDAGWEIRDCLMWLHGQGFPKSADISKHIDRAAGAEREVVGPNRYNKNKGNGHSSEKCRQAGKLCFDTAPATEAAKRWAGYGTALKPSWEPVCLAMAPLDGTFAHNALTHGVAGLAIDAGRIPGANGNGHWTHKRDIGDGNIYGTGGRTEDDFGNVNPASGRWPANLVLSHIPPDENGEGGCRCVGVRKVKGITRGHSSGKTFHGQEWNQERDGPHYASPDGTETVEAYECVEGCPVRLMDEQSGVSHSNKSMRGERTGNVYGGGKGPSGPDTLRGHNDVGGCSRFFYQAKASRGERELGLLGHIPCIKCGSIDSKTHTIDGKTSKCIRNAHPTIKPIELTKYLATLLLPPKRETPRRLLVPFAGTGSEMIGALLAGWDEVVGIELSPEHCETARWRVAHWTRKRERQRQLEYA